MRLTDKGKKLLLFVFFGIFLLTVTGEEASASAVQNVVSYAKSNKISKGKWVKNKKGLRYRKKNGAYLAGTWCSIGGHIYYFNQNGYVETRSFKYNENYYFADSKGQVYVNKWRKCGKRYYYYGANGVRAKGWKTIKGKTYYFNRNGEMLINSWVGNSYVGKDGVRVSNKTVAGRKINKSGEIQKTSSKDKYIIVGASRIVDMSIAVNSSNTVFIAKSGEGYNWLKSTAGPRLMSYLKQHSGYKVIFQLGNNDLKNINAYIHYYKALMKKYPHTEFYFLDATPGSEVNSTKNESRKAFNAKMKETFGNLCIGGYDYLFSIRFTTVDGTHYTAKVSKKLYNYTIQTVKKISALNAVQPAMKTAG